jgi:hypothetical protein
LAPGPRGSDAEAVVAAPAEEAAADLDESDQSDVGTEFVL